MHEKIGEAAAPESLSRPAAEDSFASAPSGDGPPEKSPAAATAVTAQAPVATTPPIPDVTGFSSPPQREGAGMRKMRGAIPAQESLQGQLF